jgi:hypothetical protein
MKTAGKENQTRCANEAASRDHGTEGNNNPAPWRGLDCKKKSSRRRSVFSLTPFIELIRSYSCAERKLPEMMQLRVGQRLAISF